MEPLLGILIVVRSTMLHARKICCRVLVEHHAERICEHVETFLRNNQTEDLRRIFLLFSELSNDQTLISFKVRIWRTLFHDIISVFLHLEHFESVYRANWARCRTKV